MKQPLKLSNSIYQQKNSGSYNGLTVKDGMLINDRPDGKTGIAQMAEMRKSAHRAEKISIMATAFTLGETISDMGESCM